MLHNPIKVIFLDIDGVFNSHKSFKNYKKLYGEHNDLPDRNCVYWLNKLIEATAAYIVISSTWRILGAWTLIEKILVLQGLKHSRTIDATPRLPSGIRGLEIQAWMDDWNNRREIPSNVGVTLTEIADKSTRTKGVVGNFVILDDDGDMEHLSDYLVQTSMDEGLCEEHFIRAANILNYGIKK